MITREHAFAGALGGIAAALLLMVGHAQAQDGNALPEWPTVTQEARPWTRWWWHGSAVDEANLTGELEAFREAGLGGVEVTPIYGVAGHEQRFIPYLTPRWVDLFTHTLREADRRGLGVDVATGTGWPFGGPWVGADDASRYVAYERYSLRPGERLQEAVAFQQAPLVRAVGNQIYETHGPILAVPGQPVQGSRERPLVRPGSEPIEITDLSEPVASNPDLQSLALDQVRFPKPLPLQTLMAYSDAGRVLDLTGRVDGSGRLDWTAPPGGDWTLYAIFQGWHGKQVERAAPGGEGNVIDHFSADALDRYLDRFDEAFAGRDVRSLRAFFNDSYEVDDAAGEANWTPRLIEEFRQRRGYDLRQHLPALFGEDTPERNERVLTDYRETISDLILDSFTDEWRDWSREHDALIRNQAHGSPANILDLYGASDIPETEGTEIQRIKFASSAAHVTGKPLTAAEAATWLDEHFLSTLADVRRNVDRHLLGGVNHVVYHGTAYSPAEEAWPGWLFYAAVHFNPRNPWWTDFAALNRYVGRVQAFLQAGRPDNDLLLYFPISDFYARRTGDALLEHFHGIPATPGGAGSSFADVADTLWTRGYSYDFISDRQLLGSGEAEGALRTPGGLSYRAVLVPATRYIPAETWEKLVDLAREGATILVHRALPADVAGLSDLDARRARFRQLTTELDFGSAGDGGVREARLGQGRFLMGEGLEQLLARGGVRREPLVDRGLQFIRRGNDTGTTYFIVNPGEQAVDAWVPLETSARAVALFDPMMDRRGYAQLRSPTPGRTEVYLQLGPGESRVVQALDAPVSGRSFPHHRISGEPEAIRGGWSLEFGGGGPQIPAPARLEALGSWTELPDDAARSFSGTGVYRTSFARPAGAADGYLLDLGTAHQSARVRLNGTDLGTLLGPTFRVTIPASMLREVNELEVRVTNLMANRIADLDRRGVFWKKFYNVNMPARLQENRGADGLFSAAGWTPLPSGLLGPVMLTPVEIF